MARIKLSGLITDIRGSLGGATFQGSQGGLILKKKQSAKKSYTNLSFLSKYYCSYLVGVWQSYSIELREIWSSVAAFLNARQSSDTSRSLSGYNLFFKYNNVRLQSGLDLFSLPNYNMVNTIELTPTFVTPFGTMSVAVGIGTNSIAYSIDGYNWTGLGNSIFTTGAYGCCWSGSRFVAVGQGTNTIAYSDDGINWTGLGASIFSTAGYDVLHDGTKFVAVGSGTNSIAYSYNGVNWTGIGTSVFSSYGYGICYNGSRYIAVGATYNTIAYSDDGIHWTGIGNGYISLIGRRCCWGGDKFVALGQGTDTIVYSYDGINWLPSANLVFTGAGYGVCYNGKMFVAAGQGLNSLAYSYDGITWFGLGTSLFATSGWNVSWNGSYFLAGGQGGNTLAISDNGLDWQDLGASVFTSRCNDFGCKRAPYLFPAKFPRFYLYLPYDLSIYDFWLLLKLSSPVRWSINFNASNCRIIQLNSADSFFYDITDNYLSLFGDIPSPGNYVFAVITPFSTANAKVFNALSARFEVLNEIPS